MKPETIVRVERVLDGEAVSWTRVASGGWSRSEHWTLVLGDGTRAFAKVASIDPSPAWLRDERHVYSCVAGPFMPCLLGWEDGEEPLLVVEDLAGAHWPPPWRDGDVDVVLAALAEVAATPPTGELPLLAAEGWSGWRFVERDPERLLRLGLVSPSWLERALPELAAADDRAPLAGSSLVHGDVRSDNLCLRDGRAILVDWNHTRVGNPAFDIAFWLPSLQLEGGPLPDRFGVDEFAPVVAGFFAAHAGLPPPEGAPEVRGFQRAQLEVALPWACRALGLPAPS
jgi:aminoglycoside phosphotransferase (APT) family kinase protein